MVLLINLQEYEKDTNSRIHDFVKYGGIDITIVKFRNECISS